MYVSSGMEETVRALLICVTSVLTISSHALAGSGVAHREYDVAWTFPKTATVKQSFVNVQFTGACGGQVDGLTCKATERPYCSNGHCHCEESPDCSQE